MAMNSLNAGNMNRTSEPTFLSKGQSTMSQTTNTNPLFDANEFPETSPSKPAIDHSRDAEFRREFRAGTYTMTEEQFVSLRRCEEGLEQFVK